MAELFSLPKNVPAGGKDLEYAVIANSEALNIGDAITPGTSTSVNQFVKGAKAAASGKVLGIVQGFRPISTSSTNLTAEQTAFTAAGSNQTTVQFGVLYAPARLQNKWVATLDNPVGTTTGSGGVGLFNMSGGVNGLAEATFVLTGTGSTSAVPNTPYVFSSIGSAGGGTGYPGSGIGYATSQVFGFFNLYV